MGQTENSRKSYPDSHLMTNYFQVISSESKLPLKERSTEAILQESKTTDAKRKYWLLRMENKTDGNWGHAYIAMTTVECLLGEPSSPDRITEHGVTIYRVQTNSPMNYCKLEVLYLTGLASIQHSSRYAVNNHHFDNNGKDSLSRLLRSQHAGSLLVATKFQTWYEKLHIRFGG